MGVLYRPRFCAPSPTETSQMAARQMDYRSAMGNRTMDPVAPKETISQTKIQTPTGKPTRQGQRSRQTNGRQTKLWTTVVTSLAFIGPTMADSDHSSYSYGICQPISFTTNASRLEGGQGQRQTAQVPGGSVERTKGRPAGRAPDVGCRGDGTQRPRGDKTPPLCGHPAREGQKGPSGCPDFQVTDAHSLAEFSGTVCGSMVQIYRPIHAARASITGTPQASTGKLGRRQRKPECLPDCSRPLSQRRCVHAERSRRFRDQGLRELSRAKDSSKLSRIGHQPEAVAQPSRSSCPIGGGARPTPKKTQDISPSITSTASCRRGPIPFWQARVNTIATSIAQGLVPCKASRGIYQHVQFDGQFNFPSYDLPFCPEVFDPTLKWQHTVLQESDFLDDWSAIDRAFHLATETNFANLHDGHVCHAVCSQPFAVYRPIAKSLRPCRSHQQLRFHTTIQLYIGVEGQSEFQSVSVHECVLSLPGKPWSLVTQALGTNFEHRHVGKLLCPQCEVSDNQGASVSVVCTGSIARNARSDHDFAFPSQFSAGNLTADNDSFCPLLHQVPIAGRKSVQSVPGTSHFRIDHESPIAGLPLDQQHEEDEDDEATPPHDQNADPAFVRRLIERFSRAGMNVHDQDFEVAVRTWYLDHVNMRRCTASRILQLVGPPQGWEAQFSSLWTDMIAPQEWFDISIVHPDPPRPQRHSFVQCDLILTQSFHVDRFEGLVTVLPAAHEAVEMYAVAYSFSDFISGFDITNAADADRLCRYHPCTITFGWDEIPHSLRPLHIMRHGDGFQVLVRNMDTQSQISEPQQPELASSSHEVPHAQSDSVGRQSHTTVDFPWWDDPVHGRFTTPLHLFQLEAHDVTVELVNAQLALPSHAISAATNVPFECLEAIHLVRDRPIDFPEMAIPAILQRTGDIPIGSTDRLILIDIIYHHHSSRTGPPNRPTVVRLVHRVDFRILRPQLLMYAAVYHYCEIIPDTCDVVLDRLPWPPTDLEPRSVQHGSYARITVPPPRGYEVNTIQAAQALQLDADTDDLMDLLQDDSPDDDATSLHQINACRSTWRGASEGRGILPTALPPDATKAIGPPFPDNQRSSVSSGNKTEHRPIPMHGKSATQEAPIKAKNKNSPTELPPGEGCHIKQPKTPNTLHRYFAKADVSKHLQTCPQPRQQKCSESQQQDPPSFATRTNAPHQQHQPQRPRPVWRMELDIMFDEHARTYFQETGPTMSVSVWYIHHVRHSSCLAPRIVELDDVRDLWYADLCAAWWDRIVPQQPLKVLIVKPTPDNQLHPRAQVHIILEQAFANDKAALVFTAVFMSNFRNGVLQKAMSVSMHISAQYMIDRNRLNEFCDHRPCEMFSGIMRFHRHVEEEIFSGISVHLVVGLSPTFESPRSSQPAASSSDPMPHISQTSDQMSLMQRVRRWQRTRPNVPSHNTNMNEPVHIAEIEQLPTLQLSDLREFRATLQWALQQHQPDVCNPDYTQMKVQTWFLDSFRVTRSSSPRTVLLRTPPHTWTPDILHRWQDTLDHRKPVFMHVVQPTPTDSTNEIHAYVLVVQTPNPMWRSALISIVHFDRDPWNPTHLAVMIDVETSVRQLSFIADVHHPANALADQQQVEVRHASILLDDRSPFHVRDGYHFDLVVFDSPDPWDDSIALIQLSICSVKASMKRLHHCIDCAARQHMTRTDHGHEGQIFPMSVAQDPRRQPPVSPWEALPFFAHLQALWQPLSLLSPPDISPSVLVTTWFLDHIRYPQCFESRQVRLSQDPFEWLRQIRQPWFDVILPTETIYFHIVQPPPPQAEPDVAAHIILVQQPIDGFRSVLLTLFDSAFIGAQTDRYASMAPTPLAFPTLVGLAYRDIDCADPANTCDAWVGREELLPHEQRDIVDGLSVTVAIHRPIPVVPDQDDPWHRSAEPPQHTSHPTSSIPPTKRMPSLKQQALRWSFVCTHASLTRTGLAPSSKMNLRCSGPSSQTGRRP